MTHRLLGPSGAYWKTGRPTGQPTGFWAFWSLLNHWQANWMTHRLLGPSGAYWTTGRPTGWSTGFWGLLGLTEQLAGQLDNPQASGPSGTYWTTGRPTGWSTGFWGLLGLTEQLAGQLDDPQASGAFWGLLNDPLNDLLFVQCKLTAGPTEWPTIGFFCAYLNDWFKCRSVGWPSWVNFRSRWSVWLGDLNESICPILIGWLSVLVGWPFKLLTLVSCFRWL